MKRVEHYLKHWACRLESRIIWQKNHKLLDNKEKQSFQHVLTQDVVYVEDLTLYTKSLVYAVFVLEKWLTKVKFLVLKRPAGKEERTWL